MLEFSDLGIKVRINLEPGIWVFDNDAATGKTRLCKLLKKLREHGEAVNGFSYEDYESSPKSLTEMLSQDNKVVLLDRYDLYPNSAHEEICKCAARTVVLIDCKRGFMGSNTDKPCYIDMTSDLIEVSSI